MRSGVGSNCRLVVALALGPINGRQPMVNVMAASSRQTISRTVPSFFTLTPSEGFAECPRAFLSRKLKWIMQDTQRFCLPLLPVVAFFKALVFSTLEATAGFGDSTLPGAGATGAATLPFPFFLAAADVAATAAVAAAAAAASAAAALAALPRLGGGGGEGAVAAAPKASDISKSRFANAACHRAKA